MPALRTADTSRESWTQRRTKRGALDTILDILKGNLDSNGMRHIKSNGGKLNGCLKCCAGLVATVLVVAPIAVFVIMPIVGQHILDTTSMAFPTSTIVPCSNASAVLVNTATFNFDGSFGSQLQAHQATLSVSTLGMPSSMQRAGKCAAFNSTAIGSYMVPETRLATGATQVEFTANMTISNATLFRERFITPMFLNGCQVMLTMTAHNVAMVVLGIKLTGLQIKSQMFCSPQRTRLESKNPISHCMSSPPEMTANRRLDAEEGYTMHCTDGVQRNLTLVV